VVEAERRGLVNTVDQDLELQVYLPDEAIPAAPESDLAAEEPRELVADAGPNGRPQRDGTAEAAESAKPVAKPGFDLLEELTPYELKTICKSVASLREPASFVEIFSSIRALDERGELELSQEEIWEVIEAMLETGFLAPTCAKPYEQAKANMTFYALDRDREEVKTALNAS
jgi:hypothetical protein